jgi:hypothetical protein
LREVQPGVWWIGVPIFSSGDDTALLLKSLMEEVEKKGAHSSCLNFADAVLMVPGVKLIGAATSALEYFDADVAYDGAWSDAAVRAWVMGVVRGR